MKAYQRISADAGDDEHLCCCQFHSPSQNREPQLNDRENVFERVIQELVQQRVFGWEFVGCSANIMEIKREISEINEPAGI